MADSSADEPFTAPAAGHRPWWKLYGTTWLVVGVLLCCLAYLNLASAASRLLSFAVDSQQGRVWFGDDVGWPMVYAQYGAQVPSASLANVSLNKNAPWRIASDLLFAALVLVSAALSAEAIRKRFPEVLRVTIGQLLSMTTFAAIFVVTSGQAWNDLGAAPVDQALQLLVHACQIAVYSSFAFSLFFLSKPRWWRNRGEPGKV